MKKLCIIILFLITYSCGGINFVYKDNINITNPLYEKTRVSTSGLDLALMKSYIPMIFGIQDDDTFILQIDIIENKKKISVEKNQAASNIKYELKFYYTLVLKEKNCVSYKKEISSYFTILPKSDGYNYGTDASLEKKYELAIDNNLNKFVSFLSDIDINNCQ